MLLNSNLQDDRASILREAETFKIDAPILIDRTQAVGESLQLIRTAEILLIDPRSWEIVYRGPVITPIKEGDPGAGRPAGVDGDR